jgi:arginase
MALGAAAALSPGATWARADRPFDLILAPNNLGLRPPREGHEPGAWRAPAVLEAAGLARVMGVRRRVELARLPYDFSEQPGTRIRNGVTLRRFLEGLAREVEQSLRSGGFPLVVGGDCSDLVGCMAGLRRAGGRGLVHIDGHSDFFHPGNYDTAKRLGSVAGMDLAVVTGRGEALMTDWPGVRGPLADGRDVVQVGEREASEPDYSWNQELDSIGVTRIFAQDIRDRGVAAALERAVARLKARAITSAWIHIDLDVLDQAVMPAVDSPGSPGISFAELAELIAGLMRTNLIAGADVAIYDPDLDPAGRYAGPIVDCLARGFGRA